MSVVNNCSKRGVKLIEEYMDYACNVDLRQNIFTTGRVYKSKINGKKDEQWISSGHHYKKTFGALV